MPQLNVNIFSSRVFERVSLDLEFDYASLRALQGEVVILEVYTKKGAFLLMIGTRCYSYRLRHPFSVLITPIVTWKDLYSGNRYDILYLAFLYSRIPCIKQLDHLYLQDRKPENCSH